jgi:hypothetical protein
MEIPGFRMTERARNSRNHLHIWNFVKPNDCELCVPFTAVLQRVELAITVIRSCFLSRRFVVKSGFWEKSRDHRMEREIDALPVFRLSPRSTVNQIDSLKEKYK